MNFQMSQNDNLVIQGSEMDSGIPRIVTASEIKDKTADRIKRLLAGEPTTEFISIQVLKQLNLLNELVVLMHFLRYGHSEMCFCCPVVLNVTHLQSDSLQVGLRLVLGIKLATGVTVCSTSIAAASVAKNAMRCSAVVRSAIHNAKTT